MSFGYAAGDAVLLTQLAWKTVQNTRKACGEHDELTQEVLGLHIVLRRLKQEISKPESPLNRTGDTYKEEIEIITRGCSKVLRVLDTILEKYNRLSEEERSWRKLWQKIRFGNGEIADLQDLRSKMVTNTSALSLTLNMASLGSLGRIEKQMTGDLQEIKIAINGNAACLIAKSNDEGSILTSYANDDKSVWKQFRRDLCRDGFSSSDLKRHRALIMAYIRELGDRGLFDESYGGGLKSVEELEVSNAYPATKDLLGQDGPKRSFTDQPLLSAESTSAVLHRDRSVTALEQRLRLSPYEINDADCVSGDVPHARLTTESSIDNQSDHYLASTSEITSVSEAFPMASKGLEGTDISRELERKPLHAYAESITKESMEEFDNSEILLGLQVTPMNVSCTVTRPSSHRKPSVDPIESIQTNNSASNTLSIRSQESIIRTPPPESMDVEIVEHRPGFISSEASEFHVAPTGCCLDAELLVQFEDRVHMMFDCQKVLRHRWKLFGERLDQFAITASLIISSINIFLATLGPNHGSYKASSSLADFTSAPFKVGIFSSYEDGSGDLEDLGDILINVRLWMMRFDHNCGGIVSCCENDLTSRNSSALHHWRNRRLRLVWWYWAFKCTSPISMEGTYQRPSYFSLFNEGPTSPGLLREFQSLAEKEDEEFAAAHEYSGPP